VALQDYQTLIEAVLALSTQIADTNPAEDQAVEEAQRIVLRSLAQKVGELQGSVENLQYVPSEEKDRKLWYLELLEQQVNSAESVVGGLQTFIKKLSVEVQGSLQSAAQIKAASMDLAQNTRRTAEDIKALRQVIGLIRHDLARTAQPGQGAKTLNPFEPLQRTAYYEHLVQGYEALQNQLAVSERVRKTLEQELVALKLAQAQELQAATQKLNQVCD